MESKKQANNSLSLKLRFICTPTFGYTKNQSTPYKPTLKEVFTELLDTVNFFKNSKRTFLALNFAFHLLTLGTFLFFTATCLNLKTSLFFLGSTILMCTVFHTLWLHNYCSHQAFKWSHIAFAKIFLWINPVFLPEQGYAIAHLYHHQYSDKIGDPHGPHLGWWGNFFSIDSFSKLNTNITEVQYQTLLRRVKHIGFKMNTYPQYIKSASVENLPYFVARTITAQAFWSTFIFTLGGVPYLASWYASIFAFSFLFRDFGWRAHGGVRKKKIQGWEFDKHSLALNQRFYGYLASEWHDNHHVFPKSANYGFLPSQFQLSFQIIRGLKKIGVIRSYTDSKLKFIKILEVEKLTHAIGDIPKNQPLTPSQKKHTPSQTKTSQIKF